MNAITSEHQVSGRGIYIGDMHALQGDGEIVGHTCDVAGTVTMQVNILTRLRIDGPVLFLVVEDLPYLAKPFFCSRKISIPDPGKRVQLRLD